MGRWITGIVVIVALVAAGYWVYSAKQEWEQLARSALSESARQSARADSAEVRALSASARADSIAAEAARIEPIIRERVRIVRDTVPVPDECVEVVAQRDSLLDEALANSDRWRSAFVAESLAVVDLRVANSALRLANDTLTAALEARPRPWPKWLPEIRVGPQAGICTDGRACAGVGVSVGWKVPL